MPSEVNLDKIIVRFDFWEGDSYNKFKTYYNYLINLEEELKRQNLLNELKEVTNSNQFKAIQPKIVNETQIKSALTLSWATELYLNKVFDHPEILEIAVIWSPIKVYYSIYHNIRAFLMSMGKNPTSHRATLKAISEIIKQRPKLFPQPWQTLCDGNPSYPNYLNLPADVTVKKVSNLKNLEPEDFWGNYGMFLRTTRKGLVESKCNERKCEIKKKHIPAKIKQTIISNLYATSIFDGLYRLRVRFNYEESDIFLKSPESEREKNAVEINEALIKICNETNQVLELLTARYLGKQKYEKIVKSVEANMKKKEHYKFVKRWDENKTLW